MRKVFDNQNYNYPIVLIPESILNFLNSDIDEKIITSELKLSKPEKKKVIKPFLPEKYYYKSFNKWEIQSNENSGCFIQIAIGSIIISPLFSDTFIEGIKFIFYFTLIYSGYFTLMLLLGEKGPFKIRKNTIFKKFTYNARAFSKLERDYEEKIQKYDQEEILISKKYNNEMNDYYKSLIKHKEDVRQKILFNLLKPKVISLRGPLSIKRGAAELVFLELLDSELNEQIYVDMVPYLRYNNGINIYNPDFTFICKKSSLHIDIEIDEPYTFSDRKPIHFIGSVDDSRNDFFVAANWCVVRFSEKQIIEKPLDCINTIRSIHYSLINGINYYETNLNYDSRWTYEKSLIMQNNKYREYYLNR